MKGGQCQCYLSSQLNIYVLFCFSAFVLLVFLFFVARMMDGCVTVV